MKATVDIYEQDPAARERMQHWLSEAGYYVREPEGSSPTPDGPVDLVILATQLPTSRTLGLIHTMRRFYPTTAFLVLSREEESTAQPWAPALEATRVLSKPLTRQQLLEAARAVTLSASADFN
jgi:DNA-binding response OmpR family regulator